MKRISYNICSCRYEDALPTFHVRCLTVISLVNLRTVIKKLTKFGSVGNISGTTQKIIDSSITVMKQHKPWFDEECLVSFRSKEAG